MIQETKFCISTSLFSNSSGFIFHGFDPVELGICLAAIPVLLSLSNEKSSGHG